MNMNGFVVFPLVIFLIVTKTLAQTSAGPPSLTKILQDAGDFSNFLRLLKVTHMASQISTELQNSGDGLTILVPPDSAFSSLKSGALNSLGDKQLVQLIQFHVIPQFLTKPLFGTVSNPLRTMADGNNDGAFPLNITTGNNELKVSTGIVEATVGESLYADNQLAVYRVDHVLLPPSIFPPPSAPAPEKPEKKQPAPLTTTSSALKKMVDSQVWLTTGLAAMLLHLGFL
ncbi:hypothetical protein ACJRO7_003860 [Eucalyptus globulus]|uniref:FAS1 domain-containing protein n=1 Tax=Eucalyptus globulus TaxID=34317 RepID=A0ABD3IXN5_EUCGL